MREVERSVASFDRGPVPQAAVSGVVVWSCSDRGDVFSWLCSRIFGYPSPFGCVLVAVCLGVLWFGSSMGWNAFVAWCPSVEEVGF